MSEANGYADGVQVNTKIAEDLYNFRAKDGEALDKLLESFNNHAESLAEHLVQAKQVILSRAVVTGVVSNPAPSAAAPAGQAPVAPGGIPSCKHGVAKDLTGETGRNGQLYQWRYYCSADFNAPDKCQAKDIVGNSKQR